MSRAQGRVTSEYLGSFRRVQINDTTVLAPTLREGVWYLCVIQLWAVGLPLRWRCGGGSKILSGTGSPMWISAFSEESEASVIPQSVKEDRTGHW